MRKFVAAVVIWLIAGPSLAWETKVRDIHGQRTVEMYGYVAPGEPYGLALVCFPTSDGVATGLAIAIPSTNDFAIAPGDKVGLKVGAMTLDAEITQNDSTAAIAMVEGANLSAILNEIRAADSLAASVAGLGAEVLIPKNGLEESVRQLAQACRL